MSKKFRLPSAGKEREEITTTSCRGRADVRGWVGVQAGTGKGVRLVGLLGTIKASNEPDTKKLRLVNLLPV